MWRFSGPFARAGEESLLSCLWSPLSSPLAMSSYLLSVDTVDVIAPRKPASGSPRIAFWSPWFCEVRRCILISSLTSNFLLLLSHYSPAKAMTKFWVGLVYCSLFWVSSDIVFVFCVCFRGSAVAIHLLICNTKYISWLMVTCILKEPPTRCFA